MELGLWSFLVILFPFYRFLTDNIRVNNYVLKSLCFLLTLRGAVSSFARRGAECQGPVGPGYSNIKNLTSNLTIKNLTSNLTIKSDEKSDDSLEI